MSFGGGSSMPAPPPPPPPAPTPPHYGTSDTQQAQANYATRQRGGIASTIATAGGGLGDISTANRAGKSLLGQ